MNSTRAHERHAHQRQPKERRSGLGHHGQLPELEGIDHPADIIVHGMGQHNVLCRAIGHEGPNDILAEAAGRIGRIRIERHAIASRRGGHRAQRIGVRAPVHVGPPLEFVSRAQAQSAQSQGETPGLAELPTNETTPDNWRRGRDDRQPVNPLAFAFAGSNPALPVPRPQASEIVAEARPPTLS